MGGAGTSVGVYVHTDSTTTISHRVSEPGRAVITVDGECVSGVLLFIDRADLARLLETVTAALADIDRTAIDSETQPAA